MAASNAPKNDFTPPWLNFPDSNENTRPAGSRSNPILERPRQRREDTYNRYGDGPRPLNRQNSGTDVYDGSKRHSPSHANKHRHHSVEEDYYYYNNYPYPTYYPYTEHYPIPYGAQPTSMPRRDAKFPPQQSHARFGQMSSNYQAFSYFDFFPSGDGFSSYGGGGHTNNRRSSYAREGRGESRESRDSDRSSHGEGDDKDKIFNDDFPSLNGADDDGEKTSKHASSGGVWDNPPRSRFEDVSNDVKSSAPGLYKVVPNKSGNVRKDSRDSGRLNGSVRDSSPLASVKSGSGREGQRQSPTPAKEILSTQLVRPKPGDKKQFLRTLRKAGMENGTQNGISDHNHHQQESNNNLRKGEEEAEVVMNGVSDLQLDHDLDQQCNGSIKILSSSMEREYSFLVSLGWNPQDKTELITEDEKREFLRRSDKVKQEQQRNGRTRMLPKSWSPQHQAATNPPPPAADMNETLSSSDSSDEDL